MAALLALGATSGLAGTNIWNRGGASANASAPGNWSLGRLPTVDDTILLDGTSTSNLVWDAPSNGLPPGVAAWLQTSNYPGTVTIRTAYAGTFTNFAVAGDLAILGGAWQHPDNASVQQYRLAVSVGGAFMLGRNATINLAGLGHDLKSGPGYPGINGSAGGYGGRGGQSAVNQSGLGYGSILAPTNLGSGGYYRSGGGAVCLDVTGATTIDGTVAANGTDGATDASGSGGSVYLRTATLTGAGRINANGGQSYDRGGGGGRISLVLTQPGSTFAGFTGTNSAYGGSLTSGGVCGAGGTVYLETGDDGAGRGAVFVNTLNSVTPSHVNTPLPPNIAPGEVLSGSFWVVTNKAQLGVTSNVLIRAATLTGTQSKIVLGAQTALVASESFRVNGVDFGTGTYAAAAINALAGTNRAAGLGYVSVGGTPAVQNLAPVVEVGSAVLNGLLVSTGLAATAVSVYWGPTDGATNRVAWYAHEDFGGPWGDGATFVTNIALPFATVHYRFYATNDLGEHWATSSQILQPGDVTIIATDSTASKQPYDPGSFTISRPADATGTPLSITYALSGTASNGGDYVTLGGSVTMAVGAVTAVLAVDPRGNWWMADRSVTCTLLPQPALYHLGAANNATVTLLATPAPGGTNCWLTGSPTNPANWSLGRVPQPDDAILIGGWAKGNSLTWDSNVTSTVASWLQTADYGATVTVATTYAGLFTNLTVNGDVALLSGLWRHVDNGTAAVYLLRASIGGDLTLASNTTLSAYALGYSKGNGPGGGNASSGGSHGGRGFVYTNGVVLATYGSVLLPETLGSGARDTDGGGAIVLEVAGRTRLDGAVDVHGGDLGTDSYNGAGGSFRLRTVALTGTGSISARGGDKGSGTTGYNAGGGGGRVALLLTGPASDFGGFTGAVSARGGYNNGRGAAGTVYRETGAEDGGRGVVTVDTGLADSYATTATFTAFPADNRNYDSDDLRHTAWTIVNRAKVQLTADGAVRALSISTNALLDLNGRTLTTLALTITNRVYPPGLYTTNELGTNRVCNAGSIVVLRQNPGSLLRIR